MADWNVCCFSTVLIHLHRGLIWRPDITLATRIMLTRFSDDIAANNIQPMDISGSNSESSERSWRVWLRELTSFAEGKANPRESARKRSELLNRASSGIQDIFENLVIVPLEGQDEDLYQQTVWTLNAYFHVRKNAVHERHVLRKLRQEPGEDVDSFSSCFGWRNNRVTMTMELRSSDLQ